MSLLRTVQISMLCFVLAAVMISITAASSEKDSIYEILKTYGFPSGVFPKGVKEFNFDGNSGRFSVYLNQPCDAIYQTEMHYEANVTGTMKVSEIKDLSGISAQDLFLRFPVKGIRVDVPSSGIIYFDVGVVRKQFSLSFFETPRDCIAVGQDDKDQSAMLKLHQVDQTLGRDNM